MKKKKVSRYTGAREHHPRLNGHKGTDLKYRKLRGEESPIVGGSLEALEAKLKALG